MANAYVIISVVQPSTDTSADPQIIITGTVNGVQVTVSTWKSVYTAHAGTAVGFQSWVTPLMLAQYNLTLPPTTSTPPIDSWSQ